MMTRRTWWIGVSLLVLATLLHAALPRYAWLPITGEPTGLIRIDRWTGRAEWGALDRATGTWRVFTDPTAKLWSEVDRAIAGK